MAWGLRLLVGYCLFGASATAADMQDPEQVKAFYSSVNMSLAGDWKAIGESSFDKDGAFSIFFIGLERQVVKGRRFVTAWIRLETSPGNSKAAYSTRLREEFDCVEFRYRVLSTTGFSESNLAGEITPGSQDPSVWLDSAPGTISDGLLREACKSVKSDGQDK
jgi:hypothetical protein